MDIKDIKIGMKVRLLGKHGFGDDYDNIEDWFEDDERWDDVQQIKKQGFAVVTVICQMVILKWLMVLVMMVGLFCLQI